MGVEPAAHGRGFRGWNPSPIPRLSDQLARMWSSRREGEMRLKCCQQSHIKTPNRTLYYKPCEVELVLKDEETEASVSSDHLSHSRFNCGSSTSNAHILPSHHTVPRACEFLSPGATRSAAWIHPLAPSQPADHRRAQHCLNPF